MNHATSRLFDLINTNAQRRAYWRSRVYTLMSTNSQADTINYLATELSTHFPPDQRKHVNFTALAKAIYFTV